jgi:hypothetical protein
LRLASTSTTASECESKALTADVSTTTASISALTNAHTGTGNYLGEIICLNRNVLIKGASTSLGALCNVANGTLSCTNTEFKWMTGINLVPTSAGTVTFTGCTYHDESTVTGTGIYINDSAASVTITGCGFYAMLLNAIKAIATSGAHTITNNVVIKAVDNGIDVRDMGSTITGNRVAGSSAIGIAIGEAAAITSFSGNVAHSNTGDGLQVLASGMPTSGTIGTQTSWKNAGYGITINATGVTVSTPIALANTAGGIFFGATTTTFP